MGWNQNERSIKKDYIEKQRQKKRLEKAVRERNGLLPGNSKKVEEGKP